MLTQPILREIKKSCRYKLSQGDVNVYILNKRPNIETQTHESPILVTGDGGHNHSAKNAISIGKAELDGRTVFLVEFGKDGGEFAHDGKHQPPFFVEEGFYLIDRAREKGMLNDMVAPVAD